jgi:hypothetical protein
VAKRPEALVLLLLAVPTVVIDWQIAATWRLPLWVSLLAGAVAIGGLVLVIFLSRFATVGSALTVAMLYGLPVLGGIVRWRLVSSPRALIGDGAYQIQIARDVLLRGTDPYGFNYVGTGMERTPWSQPFPNPSLHHLDYWPGTIVLPLPIQAAFNAAFGWWDERIWLLVAAIAVWILLGRLVPGEFGRIAAAAMFLLPGHSLLAVLGDNDLTMIAWLLGAALAISKRQWLLGGLLLGVALATKQTAIIAIPVFIAWAVASGVDRRRFLQALGVGAVAVLVLLLPFAFWNWRAFVDDTILFNFGSGTEAYPIQGLGLSSLLLSSGVIHGPRDAFPFLFIQIPLVAGAWVGAWFWLRRHGLAGDAILWMGFALLLFLLTNRFTQQTYLVLGVELMLAGLILRLDNRRDVSLVALRPHRVGPGISSHPRHLGGNGAEPPTAEVG